VDVGKSRKTGSKVRTNPARGLARIDGSGRSSSSSSALSTGSEDGVGTDAWVAVASDGLDLGAAAHISPAFICGDAAPDPQRTDVASQSYLNIFAPTILMNGNHIT
jgi:hypothetical protein